MNSRLENIKKFANDKNKEVLEKKLTEQKKVDEYKKKIRELKTRISEIIEVGNACLENDIPLEGRRYGGDEGYDSHQFVTNAWSHLLGFVKEKGKPIEKVGIIGGGFCKYNLITDGDVINVDGETEYILKRFVDEFDEFEIEFYKYVDKTVGGGK